MINLTNDQRLEMLGILKAAHQWIDALQTSGVEEKLALPAIHTALVERYLRAGGVSATVEFLQQQADLTLHLGHAMVAEQQAQGR